jgi:hypothetical protein
VFNLAAKKRKKKKQTNKKQHCLGLVRKAMDVGYTHICPRNCFLSNYDKFVQNNLQTTTQMII